MKIAVIGCSESHDLAPFNDPSWVKWGLRQDPKYWPIFDLTFEIHLKKILEKDNIWDDVIAKSHDAELILREDYGLNTKIYPLEEIYSIHGKYLTSSVAYMLALAIHKEPKEIGIWGVEMNEDKYHYQRPNLEYLIGYAKGKGIKITIPHHCPLLKAPLYGI